MNRTIKDELIMRRMWSLLVAGALLLPAAACTSTDELTDVTDPDIVGPADAQSPAGAAAMYAGGVGNFSFVLTGDAGGTEGMILVSGLMSDEYIHSGTFPTRLEYEVRSINERNGTLSGVNRNLHRARVTLEEAAALLQQFAPTPATRIGEAFLLAGFTYVYFGENYCSGVPFSALDGTLGVPRTTNEIFQLAIERFDTALTYVGGNATLTNAARVGRGRALLNMGNFAGAASAVSAVPDDFVYLTTHTTTTSRQQNGVHVFNWLSERWSVADNEGLNGLNFRSAGDPRVQVQAAADGIGFDSSTPQWNLLKYPSRTTSIRIADGVEVRLIEAEAQLQSAGGPAMLAALNALRADAANNGGFNLAPLADPGTQVGYENLLFRERAFWLFATGHRLADLRRLMRQYGRGEDAVFPTGTHFKGDPYGNDVALPVPFDERNNPNFTGCSTTTP